MQLEPTDKFPGNAKQKAVCDMLGKVRVFASAHDAAKYAAAAGWWLGREVLTDATPANTETPR